MFNIWAFLLQTLTASGVAALLLVIKGLFKDKLPPKWHFFVWGSLGVIMLLPAGFNGRYTLFRWQVVIEVIKGWLGDFSFTRVLFPIPILKTAPETFLDWLFAVYVMGVAAFAVKYIFSYVRLRFVLSKGTVLNGDAINRIRQIADEHKIKLCKVIEVPGLSSAFVCGVIKPILAVPAGEPLDDKIILHELFHLKHRDTFWSFAICLMRCVHWCNPLLIYCANCAINDMESRCDQYVLECLEGEERRDYGRILLSMANERYAKTPGSTCINNGGKNIRDRIEAIARFKRYPAGMGLVSVCVIVVLTLSLVVGVRASGVYNNTPTEIALASARSTPCTTYAGAFDTYAKAVLTHSAVYRTMCAPASVQEEISNKKVVWEYYIDEWPEPQSGYYIYNLKQIDKNTYEGMLVIRVRSKNHYDGQYEKEEEPYVAVQNLRVQKEDGRWTVIPLEEFRNITTVDNALQWGCIELPGFSYTATASNILVEVKFQTVHYIDGWVQSNSMFGSSEYFDTVPKPNAEFTSAHKEQFSFCTHLGSEEERNGISQIGLSAAPVFSGEKHPENLHPAGDGYGSGDNNNGGFWEGYLLEPRWEPSVWMSGRGTSFNPKDKTKLPEYYAADLYINGSLVSQLDLYPQEVAK